MAMAEDTTKAFNTDMAIGIILMTCIEIGIIPIQIYDKMSIPRKSIPTAEVVRLAQILTKSVLDMHADLPL